MPDASHARNAKARVSEMEHKGRLSPAEKAKIDAKADRVLGEKGKTMDHERPKAQERREDRKEDRKKGEHVGEMHHHVHHHVHHEAHKHEHMGGAMHMGPEKRMEARREHLKGEMKKVRST